jgi:hypothetical protein
MTVDTLATEARPTHSDNPENWVPSVESNLPGNTPAPDAPDADASSGEKKPRKAPAKKTQPRCRGRRCLPGGKGTA